MRFIGQGVWEGRLAPIEVRAENGAWVVAPTDEGSDRFLCPGFVDLHIHGAFGTDMMSADSAATARMADQLAALGYEAFLPTTITADLPSVRRALEALPEHPLIVGFHLEGPFLSPYYPGAQPSDLIIDPPDEGDPWFEVLDDPRMRQITLAPERPRATALICRLAARGVRVSLGHTNATHAEAETAVNAGVVQATHTFNAMRGFHHREAGVAGLVLTDPRVDAELIYDRIHVSPQAARLLLHCKGADRLIAVSDSTMSTGLPPNERVTMWGLDCVTGTGEVRLLSNNQLAGSAITLLDAFRNLSEDFGVEVAIKACSLNPRRALALGEPKVWLEFDSSLELVGVHRLGR